MYIMRGSRRCQAYAAWQLSLDTDKVLGWCENEHAHAAAASSQDSVHFRRHFFAASCCMLLTVHVQLVDVCQCRACIPSGGSSRVSGPARCGHAGALRSLPVGNVSAAADSRPGYQVRSARRRAAASAAAKKNDLEGHLLHLVEANPVTMLCCCAGQANYAKQFRHRQPAPLPTPERLDFGGSRRVKAPRLE